MSEKPMTIHEALRWASLFLEEHNREGKIAEILLQHHLGISRVQLLSNFRELVPVEKQTVFMENIKRHVETGIPVQHLTGKEAFYGREFTVNKHVLIPRQETEELIVNVLDEIKTLGPANTLVDLGTGSGIIATTLKLEKPELEVFAVDISEQALSVAKQNACTLGASIQFCKGSFLEPLIDRGQNVDIIVSNPPYIPFVDKPTLSDTVRNFDPELALFAEKNGLAAYYEIVEQSTQVLTTGGLIAFEIGYQQGEQVKTILTNTYPKSTVDIRKDINGKDRMVFARI